VPTSFDSITIGQLVAGGGPIVALVLGIRALSRRLHPVARIGDVILGTPEMPGVPAVPGVLERLRLMEESAHAVITSIDGLHLSVAALSTQVGGLSEQNREIVSAVAQLQSGGGAELNDAIRRIELATAREALDATRNYIDHRRTP
jgi:hypothetical protein